MYRIILFTAIILLASNIEAQTFSTLSKKEQRKLLKEERKRLEAEEQARYMKLVDFMVKEAAFVLEADMLHNKYGETSIVQSNINFLLVDSLYGVIQVGSPYYLGQNGVGGVTVEGSVNDYSFEKNEKRNTYTVKYSVRAPLGTYHVHISIMANGRADATVSGSFSGSLRYSGKLVHPAKSRVFKGTSL